MADRQLPTPRTATDTYLAAILGRLGDVLDRLPERPAAPPDGEVEIREPGVVSPGAPAPGPPPASPPAPAEPEPEETAPVESPAAPAPVEPEEEDNLGPGVRQPATRDPKQAWIDYAIARGLDGDDAHALTKQQLIDRYRNG